VSRAAGVCVLRSYCRFAGAALAMFLPSAARAQALSCTTAMSLTVPASCYVDLTLQMSTEPVFLLTLHGATINFEPVGVGVLDAGAGAATAPTVATVAANAPWQVQVSAASAMWSGSGAGARADKPASDLLWSHTAVTGFTPLSVAPATVASGGPTGATDVPLYYHARVGWATDPPGTYTLTVTYTLTAP